MKIHAPNKVCGLRFICKNVNKKVCSPLSDTQSLECNHFEDKRGKQFKYKNGFVKIDNDVVDLRHSSDRERD